MIIRTDRHIFDNDAHVIIAFPRYYVGSVLMGLHGFTGEFYTYFDGMNARRMPFGSCEVKEVRVRTSTNDPIGLSKQMIICYSDPTLLAKKQMSAEPGKTVFSYMEIDELQVRKFTDSVQAAENWIKETGLPLKVAFPFRDAGVSQHWDVIYPIIDEIFINREVIVCEGAVPLTPPIRK